jgi:hypothetical protein
MHHFKGLTLILSIFLISVLSCKNDPKSAASDQNNNAGKTTTSSADVSKLENLDHDFNITPEGSRLFFRGFFNNELANSAVTINKGKLHIKDAIITGAEFNLNMNTLEQVANRNEATVRYMKGDKVFDNEKFKDGKMVITACTKLVNDQQASHSISGYISLHGHEVKFENIKARIDYANKNIAIISDQIILKASEFGIKMADPSQDNIYFSLTLNGTLL